MLRAYRLLRQPFPDVNALLGVFREMADAAPDEAMAILRQLRIDEPGIAAKVTHIIRELEATCATT